MKRLLSRITPFGVLVLLLAISACDLAELNENPNESTEVQTPYLLTNAQQDLAQTYWDEFYLGRFGILYGQYWAQNQYTDEDRYGFPTSRATSLNSMWGDYYLALNNLQEIVRLNQDQAEQYSAYGDNENQIAIARIMQAWTAQVMTDIWGPIPFSEALQGTENPAPSYDSQEEVYRGLIDTLTNAVDMIDPSEPGITSGDLVYGGDMEQWQRFGNSLKLRVAMRMSEVDEDAAATAIQEVVDSGIYFMSNNDNALVPFSASEPYLNPINEQYDIENRDDWAVSAALVDLMQENSDPRLPVYADPEPAGEIVGFPYGMEQGAAAARYSAGNFSRPGERVRGATDPAILMLYDEVLFILAEAAEEDFISGDPASYYEQAIQASMDFWGVDDDEAQAYIERVPYDSGDWRQVLGEQKWLALYMQGVQGWSEWRRLEFEGVLQEPVAGPVSGVTVPDDPEIAVRLPYPSDEANLNTGQLEEGLQLLGGPDNQATKLWWDVEPQ